MLPARLQTINAQDACLSFLECQLRFIPQSVVDFLANVCPVHYETKSSHTDRSVLGLQARAGCTYDEGGDCCGRLSCVCGGAHSMSMTDLCTPCHLEFIKQAPLHLITSRPIHRMVLSCMRARIVYRQSLAVLWSLRVP